MGDTSVQEYSTSQAEVLRLYDRYRDCLLSKKYYATKLVRRKRWTLALDLLAALSASTALVLIGMSVAGHPRPGWSIAFGVVAAVSTVVRPLLRLQDSIDHYGALHFGYTELAHSVDNLVADIRRSSAVNATHQAMIEEISRRYRTLLLKDDPTTDRKLLVRFQAEVLDEVKTDSLWLPAT